jgi:hypothetical protein
MKQTTWETKRRWEGYIKMDFVEVWYESVKCIHLAWDNPVSDTFEHGNETSGSIETWKFLGHLSDD